jgi:glucose uptake protein GlcU
MTLDILGLFLLLSGFIVGLGAVTVIDIHGFLGRKSGYWTEATTRAHKVTKPLIWLGMFLAILGGLIFFRQDYSGTPSILGAVAIVLILNGIFLSFSVSPFLLKREKEGRQAELLPKEWQNRIIVSLIVSDLGWWGSLLLLVIYLLRA